MAKFSFHCQNYKASQICAIDKHNRRLNKHYHSNPDIDTEKSANNRIYVAPKETLFKDCKNLIDKKVVAYGGRITKASNWLTECIFSYPDELPADRIDEYNNLILKYMGARLGEDNILSCIYHGDEIGLGHLHLCLCPIVDNKLSSKTLITRDFITSIHKIMPIILQNHGFDIESYEETETKKGGNLSVRKYKKAMEKEKEELNHKLDDMVKEYNELAEQYNKLLDEKSELERKNRQKAYEVINQQERSR